MDVFFFFNFFWIMIGYIFGVFEVTIRVPTFTNQRVWRNLYFVCFFFLFFCDVSKIKNEFQGHILVYWEILDICNDMKAM